MTRPWSPALFARDFPGPRRRRIIAMLLAFVLLGVALEPPANAAAEPATSARVVVNEFGVASSTSSADSFFELRNTTDSPIDLTGWSIFRCDERGLRENLGRPEVSLTGVVLGAGEVFLAAQMSARLAPDAVDARFSQLYSQTGLGLMLIDPAGRTVDAVAMYPNTPWPTQSECAPTPNLPATLSAALDESWQRTDAGDWVRAAATPGGENAQSADTAASSAVDIDEIAAAGPGGGDDDFVEVRNAGKRPVDVSGWLLYRCTRTGSMTPDSLQLEFPRDRLVATGERLLIAGPGYRGEAEPDFRTATSLADAVAGVALINADGERVAGVSLSEHADTACQTGDDKLGSSLDYRAGHSWQRTSGGFAVAVRTPGEANAAPVDTAVAALDSRPADVMISEFATDPVITPTPVGVARSNFVEVANFSDTTRDVGGWQLYACGKDGFLSRDPIAGIPPGTLLRPGATFVAAVEGTPAAASADATFTSAFDFQGAGVWLEDAQGERVDGVGAFHVNEMDRSIDTASPCTSGLSLPVFAVDRLRGESYHRTGRIGDDMSDFTAAIASPGLFDQPVTDRLETRALAVADGIRLEPRHAPVLAPAAVTPAAGSNAAILEAYAGRSSGGALQTRVGSNERAILAADAGALAAADDGYDFPYVRFSIAVEGTPASVQWQGEVLGRSELRLSVWNPGAETWRELDAAHGEAAALVEEPIPVAVQLSGDLTAEEVVDGAAWLLVQVVPRTGEGLTADEELAAPADYDFAVSHLTDTQYLTEAYPEVYADIVGWVVGSAENRKIAFATHTGDLVQNWVDPEQHEDRARHEFEIASRMQAVLDEAGVPNSVLPGNHDTKRGVTSELFNEYFGPARYADMPSYAGSIAPDDNTANYSLFTAGGARMMMLSLPYAYGEREIAWAEQVVQAHPEANVIVSTHEHVTPKLRDRAAGRSNSSRWVSHADQLWERVIAPHRNVVVVLSGHFHGIGSIVTENAGGIPGHTVLESLADYQEFRTHTGERATGFARFLQFDLGGGRVGVDALSSTLGAMTSYTYDYEQFVRDDGSESTASNDRPWRVIERGLQNRYTAADDHFTVDIAMQYAKGLTTSAVSLTATGSPATAAVGAD